MQPRIPSCPKCRGALETGPHLHESQCVKAKKHESEALQDAMIAMAIAAGDQRMELGRTRGLLWNVIKKLAEGGKIEVPDTGFVEVPEGFYPNLQMKRTEKDDGFILTAELREVPKETKPEPAAGPVAHA